jgi:putative flippase GtrA
MRQISRFIAVGVASTLAYIALYAVLGGLLSAELANALALLITAVANTAANRRLTFGVTGRESLIRDHAVGILAFGLALAITTVSITLLHRYAPGAGRATELVVLVSANVLATLTRFLLLRSFISRPRSETHTMHTLEGASS